MRELAGKVALVTGGSRGIGRAAALQLAAMGADVALTYLSMVEGAEQVAEEVRQMGCRALALSLQARDLANARQVVAAVVAQLGGLDILVNNAGITRDRYLFMMSDADWREVIDTDLGGVFNCTKAALPVMLKQKQGRIINVASTSGLRGNPGQTNYAAAKAGILGFTRSLCRELAPHGILVNAICPGFVTTDMIAGINPQQMQAYLEMIPLRRCGEPAEVAAVVGFLSSQAATYITGAILTVDGGVTA